MVFPRAFFRFQLTFVQKLVERFSLTWADALSHYTTFTKKIDANHWSTYLAGFHAAADSVEWVYQWDLIQRVPGPQPGDTSLYDRALFGCFHYSTHRDLAGNATIIRPHFIKNDRAGFRALGQERADIRRAELQRMFVHVQDNVPQAQSVRGHSWLYNLDAYRRLYPPLYTEAMPTANHDEFQYLSLWGQCFDRHWQPNPAVTAELLHRVEQITDLAALQSCFPYAVLRPQCAIEAFYHYFGIANQ